MSYDAGALDETQLDGRTAAGGIAIEIPSAALAAVAAGASDAPARIRPRRSRASAMPAYDHEGLEPAQWFTGGPIQPEKRLMMAALADAIDLVLRPPAPRHSRRWPWQRDAARWLRSNDREGPHSFVNICEALALEPHRIRARVARCLAEHRAAQEAVECPPCEPAPVPGLDATDDTEASRHAATANDATDEPAVRAETECLPLAYPQPWL